MQWLAEICVRRPVFATVLSLLIVVLGIEGYSRLARRVAAAADGFRAAIESVDGLGITSNPEMSVWEFGLTEDSDLDLGALAASMDARGWALDAQPGGLHLMLSPGHDKVVEQFAEDLAWAAAADTIATNSAVPYGSVVGLSDS